MTFTCSRRSLAAMALAAGLVLPVAASAAGPGAGRGHPTPTPGSTPTTGSHQRSSISRHQVSGILAEMPSFTTGPTGPTVPAALKVQAGDTLITVIVPTTTKIVRGYGGRSSLDEFAPKDRISAQGSFKPGSTTIFNARWIKDWTIQRAYSRVVGSIVSVQDLPNSLTLQVARGRSQQVTVDLTSSTLKIVSGSAPVKVDALRKDMRVLVMGVYNRTQSSTQSTLRATRVRILSAHRGTHDLNATATATPSS